MNDVDNLIRSIMSSPTDSYVARGDMVLLDGTEGSLVPFWDNYDDMTVAVLADALDDLDRSAEAKTLRTWLTCSVTLPGELGQRNALEKYIRDAVTEGFMLPLYSIQDTLTGAVYRPIPPGAFRMGCSAEEPHGPLEEWYYVELTSPMYVGETMVTNREWAIMAREAMSLPETSYRRINPTVESLKLDYPAVNISWDEVDEVTSRLNRHREEKARQEARKAGKKKGDTFYYLEVTMMTEAEWEYACRGGGVHYTPYSFGHEPDPERMHSQGEIAPAKHYLPNIAGLYHMQGNAWEWCQDWYGPYPTDEQAKSTIRSVARMFRKFLGLSSLGGDLERVNMASHAKGG